MDTAKQVQMLQMAYAGALADTVQFSKEGVLERVTERKHAEQLANGKQRLTLRHYRAGRSISQIVRIVWLCPLGNYR